MAQLTSIHNKKGQISNRCTWGWCLRRGRGILFPFLYVPVSNQLQFANVFCACTTTFSQYFSTCRNRDCVAPWREAKLLIDELEHLAARDKDVENSSDDKEGQKLQFDDVILYHESFTVCVGDEQVWHVYITSRVPISDAGAEPWVT